MVRPGFKFLGFAGLMVLMNASAIAHDGVSVLNATRKAALAAADGPGLFHALADAQAADIAAAASDAISTRTGIAANVIVRSRKVAADAHVLSDLVPADLSLVRRKADLNGAPIRMALFSDADFWVAPSSVERMPDGMVVWTGHVVGQAGSSVSLVLNQGRITGDIFVDGHAYKIQTTKDAQIHQVVEVDEAAYAHGPSRHIAPKVNPGQDGPTVGVVQTTKSSAAIKTASSAPTTIPILFAYTATVAANAAAAGQDVRAAIQNAASVVNTVWQNSGVNVTVTPIIVAADSSLVDDAGLLLGDHLNYLSGFYAASNTGYAKLRQMRDAVGAELVQLVIAGSDSDPACGVAFVPDRPITWDAQILTYSTVRYSCIGSTNAHEIGHNMGLNHDRTTDNITDQSVYNVGYYDSVALTRDVMSYSNPCPRCKAQRLYSTPLLTVSGAPFGIAAGGTNPADGVRAVNEDSPLIAAFRTGTINSPDANQLELAVALNAAVTAGSTPIANAQPGMLCTPRSTGIGTVWFRHTPSVTGIMSMAINGISGSDVACVFNGTPNGTTTQSAAGSSSTDYFPSQLIKTVNPSGAVQLAVPVTAGTPVYVAVNGANGTSAAAISAKASTAVPQTGWWYDANYVGMGFALETAPPADGTSQPRIFLTGFFYRDDGTPNWGIAIGAMSDPTTFTGDLLAVKGGKPFGTTGTTTSLDGSLGKVTLVFSSPTSGKLTWPGGTLNLQRYIFDTNPIDYTVSGTLDSGWYWVPNDPGRGFFIEQQGTSLFAAAFQYTAAGVPTWQVVSANKISTGVWQGDLIDSQGGTTPSSAYRKSSLRNTFGPMKFTNYYPSAATYRPLYNSAAPSKFPSTYYSAISLQIQLPGITSPLTIERFRF
jgi:hypothetical protein